MRDRELFLNLWLRPWWMMKPSTEVENTEGSIFEKKGLK
jgi:hypothetical protein